MAKLLLLCLWNVFLHEQMIKGVLGQCTGGVPINIAVYEGDTNVAMMCNSPTKVSWTLRPTSDQLGSYKITSYDDVVAPTYANLFGVNSTGLNVKTAQGLATIPPISTAGLYTILINGSTTKYGAKLTVVHCGYTTTQIPTTTTMTTITIPTTSTPPLSTTTPSLTTSTHPATTTTPTATTTTTPPTTTTTPPTTTATPPTTTTTPTTLQPTANPSTALSSNAECNCPQTTSCSSQDDSCTKDSKCQPDGTALININDECVVKAELYARCDNCCPDNLICGVVVTLRDDSRWLIYDSICNDNKCEMAVVSAYCMSSNWKLMAERKIAISGVGDYVEVGNGVQVGLNATDCSESCKRMMNLL